LFLRLASRIPVLIRGLIRGELVVVSSSDFWKSSQDLNPTIQDFFGAAKRFFRAGKFSEKTQGDSLLSCRY
jgi:hypothetical protein